MKYIRRIQLSLFLALAVSVLGYGQFCADFHLTGDCKKDFLPFFKLYAQSKSDMIGVGYTIKYNIVFYGEKEYMISFCTNKNYYPLHFKLSDVVTEEVFYDNKDDDYVESIGFAIEKTKIILVEVEVLAHKAGDKEIEDFYPCIGMLIQYKPSDY